MNKRQMLLDKIQSNRKLTKKVIGIVGTHHGVGSTFTALMIAFYMGDILGCKTALIECHQSQDMNLIQKSYQWRSETSSSFSFQEVTCYKNITYDMLSELLCKDYDCFILDFGIDEPFDRLEWLRCDYKFVLAGRTDWEQLKLLTFFENDRVEDGNLPWTYLIPCADQSTISSLRRMSKRNIYAIAFEENPILPSKYAIKLFQKLFAVDAKR